MTKYIARGILALFGFVIYLMVSLMCYYIGFGPGGFLVLPVAAMVSWILMWAIGEA